MKVKIKRSKAERYYGLLFRKITTDGTIPKWFIEKIYFEIKQVFKRNLAVMVRPPVDGTIFEMMRGSISVSILTNFEPSNHPHGLIFKVLVKLKNNLRQVRQQYRLIKNDVIETIFAVRPASRMTIRLA